MLASLNWIKDFVDLSASAEEVADKLSMAGLEIEAVKSVGAGWDKIYTAKIKKIQKHPNADRLSLCEVTCGPDMVSVVCGANNMKEGDVVALARPGAKLPNGLKIKKSNIRDVESHGMLCSEKELGLAEESDGILILDPKTPHGQALSEALPIKDTILEVNVTPNRGDCLSMQGLAREVAANFRTPFNPVLSKIEPGAKGEERVQASLEAPDLCVRYVCRVLKGIQVGPAPAWMVARLESCGIRSINNVVDATNYIMLETGQPLHAFDLKQVKGEKIIVRRAKKGEVMKTLDGEERKLEKEDLVIADAKRALALAGVMGGEDSGVEEGTVDLLLESACFRPAAVRKTARRLALTTESSYRFERGVDPNGCVSVLDRLTEVLLEVAGGQRVGPVVDAYPEPVRPPEVELRTTQIKRVLGIELPQKDIVAPLKGLGIEGAETIAGSYRFKIPTFRSDLTREIDLIEELARLYGYNNIPQTYPKISLQEILPPTQNAFDRLDQLRTLLLGWGFSEVLHYSFTSPELLEKFQLNHLEKQILKNPISEEMSVMRPALFPQMVQTLQNNVFKGSRDLKLFEIRPVYLPDPKGPRPAREQWHLCLGMSGSRRPLHFLEKEELSDLLDLKGYLQSLVGKWLPGARLVEAPLSHSYFHPKRQLDLKISRPDGPKAPQEIGFLGLLHPRILSQMDLPVPVILAEINLELFLTESENSIQFHEISPFPTVWRDLNLIVDEATANGEVLGIIRSHGGGWLRQAELFDVYRGEPLPEGKKALTYRIEYGAPDRTLRDEEVNKAREKLLAQLKTAIGATLR